MPLILYHYTDAEGYAAILANPSAGPGEPAGMLRSSSKAVSGDAHYGDGWYFTDLPPDTDRLKIARALWDASFALNFHKTEYFITFSFHGNTNILESRKHVFFMSVTSNPRPTLVDHGRVGPPDTVRPSRRVSRDGRDLDAAELDDFEDREIDPDDLDDDEWEDRLIEESREWRKKESLFKRVRRWFGF